MVFSLGSGRMAVMARLLAAGRFSQSMTEEVGQRKLAAQLICKELRETDEPNLLDEEDMHIFGLKPMADPLQLVCCNTCKKPLKASQYSAHAEFCRTLNTKETMLESDGSMGHRKPTRKEKKKSLTAFANQTVLAGDSGRAGSVVADDTAVAESKLNGQIGMTSSCFMETKRYVDAKCLMEGSGVSLGNTDHSTSVLPRPTKRSKLTTGEWLPLSDDLGTVSAVSKIISHSSPKGTTSERGTPCDSVMGYKKSEQIHGCCLPMKDTPVPLATKIFYSQRNSRLRSALFHVYRETVASAKELCCDVVNTNTPNEQVNPSQVSSRKDLSLEQIDLLLNNERDSWPSSMQNPDQFLAQSSEVCLATSGGCPPLGNLSKQFTVDNVSRPQVAHVGLTMNKYISNRFLFAGNSGESLKTAQQQKGSVPVL
ncbi:hypothetical protein UlMin_009498 [Ulmus minor]